MNWDFLLGFSMGIIFASITIHSLLFRSFKIERLEAQIKYWQLQDEQWRNITRTLWLMLKERQENQKKLFDE